MALDQYESLTMAQITTIAANPEFRPAEGFINAYVSLDDGFLYGIDSDSNVNPLSPDAYNPGKKVYKVKLSQAGAGDPVVESVLQNDFEGTVIFTWARVAAGGYTLTADSAIFLSGKVHIIPPANGNNVGDYGLGIAASMQVFNAYRSTDTVINLGTGNLATATGVITASDDNLYGSNVFTVEVYD